MSFYIFWGCVFLLFLGMAIVLYHLLNDDMPNLKWNPNPKRKSLISKPTIFDYSVDPDAKFLHIFVMPSAISNFVIGHMPFTEEAQGISNIKLMRSGTGFRVYNHPTVKEGQWLPCR